MNATTRESAFKSMRRILSQFPVNLDMADYFDAIFEQVELAGIESGVFETACIQLAATMEPYKPPMASEYLTAARRIKAVQGQRRSDCETCHGLGLYLVKVFNKHSETMVDACASCTSCLPSRA